MAVKGLTPNYIESHRQNHAKFMDEVTHLYSGVTADNRESAKGLLQFLTNWLAYHILGSDQLMARQIAHIADGGDVNDVSATDAPNQDPATDALLNALNGLFQQVSERNHELVQLTKTLEARVSERTQALTERTQALTDANQQLDAIANTDVLTTLPNRRYAMRSLASSWDKAMHVDASMACIMIDADGFKQINDTHGHDAGDDVLRALSRKLRQAVRTDDIVCRLGGDEFLIICEDTDLGGALKVAEKIRSEVAALRVRAGTGEWVGSVSVGVAIRIREMKGMEDLLKAADLGVYAAKRNGRNCVAVAQ